MTQLSITQLSSEYDGNTVIKNLSLTLEQNEIVALLGPSGCGKTTLLRTIAGLQPITSGSIELGDTTLNTSALSVASEKRNIGMIFQDYALFPHLDVAKNISFGLRKQSSTAKKRIVEAMLSLVKLNGYEQRFPHELSGGQQQRIAIARALAYKPQLMLLDEPFSNIDSQSRGEIMQDMRRILKDQQMPAVFVTHSKDEAFVFADKIAIFNQGKIEQIDKATILYAQPQSIYVANFMGKANYLTINEVTDDQVFTCVGALSLDGKLLPKKHNVVMLRPEQLLVDTHSNYRFLIVNSAFAGSHWIYQVQAVSDTSIELEIHSHEALEIDSVIGLSVRTHALVTFNLV